MTSSIATAADGTTLSYTDHGGEGPAVVLVHGITESRGTWQPITDVLTDTHRVIAVDLRGHGASGKADRYDLEAMAGDIVAVVGDLGLGAEVHLVGHSLGGAVVSAVGGAIPVASIVNVDQSLQLGGFKAQLREVEAMLKDQATFAAVIEGMFAQMAGEKISSAEMQRVKDLRQPDQQVVLGVWDLMFTMSEAEIEAVVEGALAGYADSAVPYLALFGIDPGPEYEGWLSQFISNSAVEVWADHGHYPHLVDAERFVARMRSFWASDH